MKKILYFTFLIFWIFKPNFSFADDLDFYSRIDDAGDSLVENLTKRELSDFSSFKNFAKECRSSAPWLDNAPMSQKLLDEIVIGGFGELSLLAKQNNQNLNYDELVKLSSCLHDSYNKIKSSAITQKEIIEDAGSAGIFMDGDLENSDFDIIADINKINEIIFKTPAVYEGYKNPTKKSLTSYLTGGEPIELGLATRENSDGNQKTNNNQKNFFGDNLNSNLSENQNSEDSSNLTWSNICVENHINKDTTSINNMVDSRFLQDLNLTLRGGKSYNNGIDYSNKNNSNNYNNSSNSKNNGTSEKSFFDKASDYATKLPCDSVFCIRLGSNIKNENLLIGGKGSYSIEGILEKHIEKLNPISYTNLSSQKMTNNSFQLPFLKLKFSNSVAGGAVFMHGSPQTTKISPTTPKSQEIDFDTFQRCAWLEAGLSTDFEKNNGITGAGYDFNSAHNTDIFYNSTKILNPVEVKKIHDCSNVIANDLESRYYEGFSTQVNEFQTFTSAMLDIIEQILQNEQKFDNTKVQ